MPARTDEIIKLLHLIQYNSRGVVMTQCVSQIASQIIAISQSSKYENAQEMRNSVAVY